ncbi:sensor histidine kinase [Kribbella kalugense]|uniref:Sensor-like histidine kinase SenX3 n=1 Tax=Kribbella kalugense TaxID=2512221 RepID=A0A4R8A204_9ACTN|nr:HAMP domain-containing sensor histidine kinase [Kribbella kalugense]TDW24235.1 two-component system sensor histidine kinase BaeS [Kribbella kalugense]
MRRSVLVRFLGLSLAVALGAVIATALIATYSTSEKLQGEIDANTGQLQVDGEIYGELSQYASDHPTWAGVDKLVHDLAGKLGRRIAVTAEDGSVIADSARMLGAAPELPSVPAATIDARNEGAATLTGATVVYSGGKTVSSSIAGNVVGTAATALPFAFYPGWGLTDGELREREQLASKAANCYVAQGKKASVTRAGGGVPQVMIESGRSLAGAQVMEHSGAVKDTCTPPGLNAPGAKAKIVNADEVRRAAACLGTAGIKYTINELAGLKTVETKVSGELTDKFVDCTNQARVQALTPYVAPQANLYLGAKSTFNVFSGEGLLRTAATALGVLLIAALVMIFTGRRLVRPIVALTGAAQRMRNGDHAARVPVSGKDEVSRLGHAFNQMAEAIQRHDFQRKAMVSDVAHELRTPLANIKGYLVASEDGVVPLDHELVTSLLEETGLLEHLVADLQDLDLADAGMLRLHPAPRDLSELAQQVVSAQRPAAETAGITLTAHAPEPAIATVDSARIRQALGNLVSNAIRYTPPGGDVLVGVRRVDDGYNLTVTDNGSGIAEEHLPHLFDRFYRAEHSRSRITGGSGLGLAITKHLVEAHHGRISVTSRLGSGSTFTIWLPAVAHTVRVSSLRVHDQT